MRKNRKWCLSFVFSVLAAACTVDAYNVSSSKSEAEENKPLSETWSASPEDHYCLNVVYYVPADMDTLSLWHKRLSGLTLNTQAFFKDNMARYKYDKTFGLVVNDSNKNYIQMSYIKSKRESAMMKLADAREMANEVMEYFTANPSEKRSNHFLVYMPTYTGSFINTVYLDPSGKGVTDHAITFAGCDAEKFDSKFLKSARGRAAYLRSLGQVMYEQLYSFLIAGNNGLVTDSRFSLGGRVGDVVSNMLNYTRYYDVPDKITLTPIDAFWLNEIQVFNKISDQHEYIPVEDVEIDDVKFSWLDVEEGIFGRDSLLVECTFRSSDDLIGAVMYLDPWRGLTDVAHKDPNQRTDEDAMAYLKNSSEFEKVGENTYKVSFLLLWSEMNPRNVDYVPGTTDPTLSNVDDPSTPYIETWQICKAEIRFRFIGKGGMAYPQPGVSLKGDWDSNFRWYFQIRRYRTNIITINVNVPDIVERYTE